MKSSYLQFRQKYLPHIFTILYTAAAAVTAAVFGWPTILPWVLLILNVWEQQQRKETENTIIDIVHKMVKSEAMWIETCPPGELADKLSILGLKQKKIGLSDNLAKQFQATEICFNNSISILVDDKSKQSRIDHLLEQLAKINEEQWNWENKVRSEQSITAALGARECNNRRVRIKNEINYLCGSPEEEKAYASKD